MSAIVSIDASSARISERTVWTFVRVVDTDGRVGWGEATLQGETRALHSHLQSVGQRLAGRALRPAFEVATALGTLGQTSAESAAISAVDQALVDLRSQASGTSLAEAMGSLRRRSVDLYANINRGTIDRTAAGFAARARDAVAQGYRAIKIAPLDDVRPDMADTVEGHRAIDTAVARVVAVREAIGPDVRLLVDCHWRLTENAAVRWLQALGPVSLYWLECPIAETADALPTLRRLRAQANARGVLLAGCESMTGRDGFRPFVAAGAYDVIMPDVKYAGGWIEMLRIAEDAVHRGVLCSPHNPSGPIAHAHSVHVSALLDAFPFLEIQFDETPLFFALVGDTFPSPQRGACVVPHGPGLGAAIDLAPLRPLRVDAAATDA